MRSSVAAVATAFFLPLLIATAPAQDRQLENPEYRAWAAFPPGAWVKHHHVENSPESSTEQEIRSRLLGLTPEKADLEVEVAKLFDGIRMGVHRERRAVPAKIPCDHRPDRVEDREIREGREELIVGGTRLMCRRLEIRERTRSGKTTTTVWSSPEIPGEIVNMNCRQEEASILRVSTRLLEWGRE